MAPTIRLLASHYGDAQRLNHDTKDFDQRLRVEPGLDDPDLLMDVERIIAENEEPRSVRKSAEVGIFESNSASMMKPS